MRIQNILLFAAVLVFIGAAAGCTPGAGITPTTSVTTGMTESTSAVVITPTVEVTTQETEAPLTVVPPNNLTAIVLEQPTAQITADPAGTSQGQKYPPALLQIEKPGDLSRLSTPILVTANVYPGDKGLVNVQLIGEDGQLKADQLLQLNEVESGWVALATWIPFEISAAGESALIVVSTRDGYGRRIAQSSAPVILLQVGDSEVEKPGFSSQPVILNSPVNGGFAKGGSLRVQGQVHPANQNPLVIELISQTGGVVASKGITLPTSSGADYVSFSADIPYFVGSRTPVRLTIRQPSTLSGNVDSWLYSLVLFLDP